MRRLDNRIDAVEDFVYDSDNAGYNRDYKRWRKTNKGNYMYSYTGNRNEIVYVDGKTITKPDAAAVERRTLTHCGELVGAALLLYLIAELIGGTVLIWILRLFGLNIRLDFLTLSMSGSQWSRAAVRALVVVLKYGVPAFLLARYCRLPAKTAFPARVGGITYSIAATGAAMFIAGIYSVTAKDLGLEMAEQILEYKDSLAVITYGCFDVLVASLLAEMFLRGVLLPLLRQFGDGFAIVVTAFVAFLFPNALPDRISQLLLGLAAGYILIRSGSFFKCVVMHSIYTMLTYTRLIQVYAIRSMPLWQYALLLMSMGTLALAMFVHIRKGKLGLTNCETELRDREKVFAVTQNVTMLPWLAASLLLTLLQLFY